MPLFRPEALRSRDRLHGDVSLVPPVTWQTIGIGAALSVVIAFAFLALADYAQVTVVRGRIESDRGLVRAAPTRAGTIEALLVSEGQHVRKGDVLARISNATGYGSTTLEQRRAAAARAQIDSIASRGVGLKAAANARIAALAAEHASAQADIARIDEQIEQQEALVTSARDDLDKVRAVADRGFISRTDLMRREEALAIRLQGLARLRQARSQAVAHADRAAADIRREQAGVELEIEDTRARQASAEAEAAADENVASVTLIAAVDGVVTGIAAAPGEIGEPGRPLMSIIPDGSRMRARLDIPASSMAMIEAGQPVRIAVDAFPYQTFGVVRARIAAVSRAAAPAGNEEIAGPFIATADLEENSIKAYGRAHPLRPGMTVTARVRTRTRSLLEWLLDPLYAVGRR